MAHEHKLAIFRGLVKFKSVTQKIWGVLIFLTIAQKFDGRGGFTGYMNKFFKYEVREFIFQAQQDAAKSALLKNTNLLIPYRSLSTMPSP